MRIRDNDMLEVRLSRCHGVRSFPASMGNCRCRTAGDGSVSDWSTLQISLASKHRGVPATILFEIDLPVDELGRIIAGDQGRGIVNWSADDRQRRAAKKRKKE